MPVSPETCKSCGTTSIPTPSDDYFWTPDGSGPYCEECFSRAVGGKMITVRISSGGSMGDQRQDPVVYLDDYRRLRRCSYDLALGDEAERP